MQQYIEPAEGFRRSLDHVVDRPRVANVALHPLDAGVLGRRCPVIRRDNARARLAQHLSRGRADPGRTTGDEYSPAMQWLCHE